MCENKSVRWAFNWANWSPSEAELKRSISCLQVEEQERLSRFAFRHNVRASLVGRLMMRKFIHECTSLPYNQIFISRDVNSKPVFNHPDFEVSFNVSHQGFYTVLAGETTKVNLGVDVMKLTEQNRNQNIDEYFRLMNRVFSPREWSRIRSQPRDQQLGAFFRNWSLKESYSKAVGLGLSMGLDQMTFKVVSDLEMNRVNLDTVLYVDGQRQDYTFEESLIDEEHCVSVALNQKVHSARLFQIIDFDELMKNSVPLRPEDEAFCEGYFKKSENPS